MCAWEGRELFEWDFYQDLLSPSLFVQLIAIRSLEGFLSGFAMGFTIALLVQSIDPSLSARLIPCGCPFGMAVHISRSSKNSDAGSTLVISRWSRARVQAT